MCFLLLLLNFLIFMDFFFISLLDLQKVTVLLVAKYIYSKPWTLLLSNNWANIKEGSINMQEME